jgi:hypothetical protein
MVFFPCVEVKLNGWGPAVGEKYIFKKGRDG